MQNFGFSAFLAKNLYTERLWKAVLGRINAGETMADSVVVKAKIKEIATGYNVAGDFADALDRKARELIKAAVKRAEGNGRKTVMAKDL